MQILRKYTESTGEKHYRSGYKTVSATRVRWGRGDGIPTSLT